MKILPVLRKLSSGAVLVVICLSAAFVISADAANMVTVPNVIGQHYTAAQRTLEQLGFRVKAQAMDTYESRPQGTVYLQSTPAGSREAAGSWITIGYYNPLNPRPSQNPPGAQNLVTVPNVNGQHYTAAQRTLEQLGFRVKAQAMDTYDNRPGGTVYLQSIPAGSREAAGSWITIGYYHLLSRPDSANMVTVPNVNGMAYTSAQQQLIQAGFSVQLQSMPIDTPQHDGRVYMQSLRAGDRVQKGTAITLTYYKYQAAPANLVIVPDVIGMPYASAQQKLAQAGLSVQLQSVSHTNPQQSYIVFRQSLRAGDKVQRGTAITLTYYSYQAPPANLVTVPHVNGMPYASAQQQLIQAGFSVQLQSMPINDPRQNGLVYMQSLRAGDKVQRGTAITLTYYSYQAPPANLVTVPHVNGMPYASARQQLIQAGFSVQLQSMPINDPRQNGLVYMQSLRAGDKVQRGTAITLTYYNYQAPPANLVTVPHVNGMPYASARQQLIQAGFNVQLRTIFHTDPKQNGKVYMQSLRAGDRVQRGTTIVLTYFKYR